MNIKDIFRFSFLKLLIMLLIVVSALFAIRSNINILNVYGWIILFIFPAMVSILFRINSIIGIILVILVFVINAIWLMSLSELINLLLMNLFKNK
jgi:hypothetical protein